MSKPLFLAALVLFLAALALFRSTESVSAAPPEDYKFAVGKALKVTRKQGEALFLSSPDVVRLGDRLFLFGSRVEEDMTVFIPSRTST
jgi:hypothetical protein